MHTFVACLSSKSSLHIHRLEKHEPNKISVLVFVVSLEHLGDPFMAEFFRSLFDLFLGSKLILYILNSFAIHHRGETQNKICYNYFP